MAKTAKEIIDELNLTDEHSHLEAKSGFGKSLRETICAFANEPGMGGGTIILGVSVKKDSFPIEYYISGIENPDQISANIASECASVFNNVLRPVIRSENVDGKNVIIIDVSEASPSSKPVFISSKGLPKGAYRRVGSSDQQCTEEDLSVLFGEGSYESYDSHIIPDAEIDDIDTLAVEYYKKLRYKANPNAEELQWDDHDLLKALSAIRKNKEGQWQPTLTGILLFGSKQALRRLLPSVRIDYVRIHGREWIDDPENRFDVKEIKGSLLNVVQQAIETVYDDLPKTFNLPEGEIQAEYSTLPVRALREAIVNAVMHSSYRLHQPIQIRRYTNRIEICNPGYSLKNEENLGEPGSNLRNPRLGAVFHDTNLAEQKGSGIKTMRKLMEALDFAPPTFESDRHNNSFIARFLLHHFFSEKDLKWLEEFSAFNLNQEQKKALVFLRESRAIDNSTYRQLNGVDILTASSDLRRMRDIGLLQKKERGKATYYVFADEYINDSLPNSPSKLDDSPSKLDDSPSLLGELKTEKLPEYLQERLRNLKKNSSKQEKTEILIEICKCGTWTAAELASFINIRDYRFLKREYLNDLLRAGIIVYEYPDMPRHPKQAYKIGETA